MGRKHSKERLPLRPPRTQLVPCKACLFLPRERTPRSLDRCTCPHLRRLTTNRTRTITVLPAPCKASDSSVAVLFASCKAAFGGKMGVHGAMDPRDVGRLASGHGPSTLPISSSSCSCSSFSPCSNSRSVPRPRTFGFWASLRWAWKVLYPCRKQYSPYARRQTQERALIPSSFRRNQQRKSLSGFRLSVLAGWLGGDLFKVRACFHDCVCMAYVRLPVFLLDGIFHYTTLASSIYRYVPSHPVRLHAPTLILLSPPLSCPCSMRTLPTRRRRRHLCANVLFPSANRTR